MAGKTHRWHGDICVYCGVKRDGFSGGRTGGLTYTFRSGHTSRVAGQCVDPLSRIRELESELSLAAREVDGRLVSQGAWNAALAQDERFRCENPDPAPMPSGDSAPPLSRAVGLAALMAHKNTIQVAENFSVIPERAGDGTLYEVADLTGRIVSAHPCAWRAAVALAEHLDCDAENEGKQLARSERE